MYIVPAFIALSLIIAFVLNLKNNNNNQETSAVITDTPAPPPTEAITEVITTESIEFTEHEETDKFYYVSKTGTKYHLEDCNYIDVDECIKFTLEEVEKLGYEPCKICKPDKYN